MVISVKTSRVKASTCGSTAMTSPTVLQGVALVFGYFASSFAKQPFIGSSPPVNLSDAFWRQGGSGGRFLPAALP